MHSRSHRTQAASASLGRGLLVGGLALAALATAVPARAKVNPGEAIAFPAKSRGSLLFFLDAVSFPPAEAAGARTELYLRVPGEELAYADSAAGRAEAGRALLRARVRAKDARGHTVVDEERQLDVPPAERLASGFSLGHVVLLPVSLPSGWCELSLTLLDLRSQRVGLAYMMKGKEKSHRSGKVEGTLRVPDWSAAGPQLSEIEPAWSIRGGEAPGPFARAGLTVLPHPTRTYGLYATTARAYYEIARPDRDATTLTVSARVLDPQGHVLLTADPDSLRAGSRGGQVAFDVSTLAAGVYDLEVSVAGGAAVTARRTRINVAWRPESWQADPRQLLDEAHLLLDDEEKEDAFAVLSVGEQEAYLDRYWKERDPTPSTAANEERDLFYQRIAYANAHFGTAGIEKGMDSDRGRTYIRFGEPDEIRREVMPTNGLQVDDIARDIAREQGFDQAVPLRGRGVGGDMRSFEVWTYDRLLHAREGSTQGVGPRHPMTRVFVFVDEEGYGNYVLRYTND